MEEQTVSANSASAASSGASSAAVGGFLGFLNYNTAKRLQEFNQEQQYRYLREAPTHQVEGYRAAGINPMLAYAKGNPGFGSAPQAQASNIWGSGLRDASDWQSSAYGVERTKVETGKLEEEANRVRHDAERLELDNVLTKSELDGLARAFGLAKADRLQGLGATAMAAKKATATLTQIRADMAEADNFADLHELLNVPALQAGLDVIRAIPGLGGVADSISKILERRKPRTRETNTQIIRDQRGREVGRDTFEQSR